MRFARHRCLTAVSLAGIVLAGPVACRKPAPARFESTVARATELRGKEGELTIIDGTPQPHLVGSWVDIRPSPGRNQPGTRAIFHLVPIVGVDWSRGVPVTAWALCGSPHQGAPFGMGPRAPWQGGCDDPANWLAWLATRKAPLRGRLTIGDVRVAGWAKAVSDAETRHGVRSRPDAIVLILGWDG